MATSSTAVATTDRPDPLSSVAADVERHLRQHLASERDRWAAVDARLGDAVSLLADYVLGGGKRLRPAFCVWGHVAAGGDPRSPRVLDLAAALELLHGFALLHDDVMDGAELRRGRPALHRRLAARHGAASWSGEARRYGEGMAILLGDLAFAYADRLVGEAPGAVRRIWDELRIELTMGQYLDVGGAASGDVDVTLACRIAAYKSGRYTVERPLQLGVALAGGPDDLGAALGAFGAPLGEAFQLRDDLLGVFGDEDVTGKPVGDDLREGKPTLLLAEGRRRARGRDRATLEAVGRPDLDLDDVGAIRAVLERCGARAAVEQAIVLRVARADAALAAAPVTAEARAALEQLSRRCTVRDA